ncbi:hypothetical protein Mapa_012983 [Marchantia paleacea]|nr:hypothetical protein Mapa_012983 [Marchantia paleacea]
MNSCTYQTPDMPDLETGNRKGERLQGGTISIMCINSSLGCNCINDLITMKIFHCCSVLLEEQLAYIFPNIANIVTYQTLQFFLSLTELLDSHVFRRFLFSLRSDKLIMLGSSSINKLNCFAYF